MLMKKQLSLDWGFLETKTYLRGRGIGKKHRMTLRGRVGSKMVENFNTFTFQII